MHSPHSIRGARSAATALAAFAPCALFAGAVAAQSGPPPPVHAPVQHVPQQPAQPALTPYRAPVIALVQPPAGGSLPQDRPVVVFRFAQGEPGDPVDAASFAVSVDGIDRTPLFQLTAAEAWGPLAPPPGGGAQGALAPGAHQVTARICSSRGACGSVTATVTALPGSVAAAGAAAPQQSPSRKRKLLGALLDATRKVLVP